MAATNDTIDGLLAEFRGYSAGMPASYHVTMSWHDFRRMLDRFDAAHRREADYAREAYESALKAEREALREQYEAGALVDGTRGDCAKLREALDRLAIASESFLRTNSSQSYADTVEALYKARAALAAPPRNCDKFGSSTQARAEWYKTEVLPRVEGVVSGVEPQFVDWLFAPATEQKGENDGR